MWDGDAEGQSAKPAPLRVCFNRISNNQQHATACRLCDHLCALSDVWRVSTTTTGGRPIHNNPPCEHSEHAPALSLLPFGNPVRISGCIEKQNGTYWNRKSTRAPRRTSKKRDAGDNHETAAGIDRHRPPTSAQRPHPEPCGVRSAEPTDRGSRRHCADVGERRLVLYGALFRGRGAFFRALRGHHPRRGHAAARSVGVSRLGIGGSQ